MPDTHQEPQESAKRLRERVQFYERRIRWLESELRKEAELRQLLTGSLSWKITAPLRLASTKWWGLRRKLSVLGVEAQEADRPREKTNGVAASAKEAIESIAALQLGAFLSSDTLLELPDSDTPEISVILVLYNKAALTFACLRSILEYRGNVPVEIIIVDNASSDDTGRLLSRIRGPNIIVNEENRGFLLACNQAAQAARGRNLLFLNNDAQLMPGTMQAALRTLNSSHTIGAVGARIILLDGTLQEAGSIVWRDGSCVGYGRGGAPDAPEHMFMRDVDFCSGAFLLTPRTWFSELGGFDEALAPAYFEEVDYCMGLRERGLRTVYEPRATIAHYEFASASSREEAINLQTRNRRLFSEKWRSLLANQLESDTANTLLARCPGTDGQRVLIFDDRVPHRGLGRGYPRANAMISEIDDLAGQVTLYPLAYPGEPWDEVYSDLPRSIEVMMGYGLPSLERFLSERAGYYRTVVVSRPHNARIIQAALEKVPNAFDGARVVYDAEAIFALREAGKSRFLEGKPLAQKRIEGLIQEEIALTRFADTVLAVSEAEREQFRALGASHVQVLGHSIDARPGEKPFSNRSGFLFVGAIPDDESPNADALLWFLEHVWSDARKALDGEVKLLVAGAVTSARILNLHCAGVEFLGFVEDLAPLYHSARVFVAPHRFAAGIPYKVHEATAYGLPVVASELIRQQLGWNNGEALLSADTADAPGFAAACTRLHSDEDLWWSVRGRALEHLREECSPKEFRETIRDVLAAPA